MQRGSLSDYLSKDKSKIQEKEFVFRLITSARGSSMKTEDGRPIAKLPQTLQATGTIDWKNNDGEIIQRRIRYYNGAKTIFVDTYGESVGQDKSPNFLNIKHANIKFDNNIKVVKGKETVLLDFLMAWDLNQSKPNRDGSKVAKFYLIDTAKASVDYQELDKAYTRAKSFVWDGDYDEVMAYARLKGVDMSMQPQEIRATLIGHIDPKNPQKFLEEKDNPSTLRKYFILTAVDRGILVHNEPNRTLAWGTNLANPILRAPLHIDVIDEMVKFSFSEEGEKVMQRVRDMVSPAPKRVTPPVPTKTEIRESIEEVEPEFSLVSETDEELEVYISRAINGGIIESKPPMWLVFDGKNYKKKEFLPKLKSDKYLLPMLKDALGKLN